MSATRTPAETANDIYCILKKLNSLTTSKDYESSVVLVPNNTTGFYDEITYSWIQGIKQPNIVVQTTYPIAQTIIKDVEYVANETTKFYDKIVHTYINGVPQPDVVTQTTYPISSPPPTTHNFEWVCDISTGFYTEIEKITNYLGVTTTVITATTIVCYEKPKDEIDYIHTNWLPFCVDGIQWYVGEEYSFNNTTATKTYIGKIYKEGALGVPTITLLTGTLIVDGICEKCLTTKQFEFGYYKTLPVIEEGIKALGFQNGINADFTQPISGNYEVYFVIDGVPQQGNGAGAGYGADYPITFNSLQDICNYFNNHVANTVSKDVWKVDAANNAIFIDGTVNHSWTDMVVAHYDINGVNDYNLFKDTPTSIIVDKTIAGGCRKIEILKELDCNGILTLKGFEINGTLIIPFDANLVFNEDASKSQRDICINTTTGEIWNVVELTETSPCGVTTVKYMDMDTSPITDVTSLFASFRHNGECGCCKDKI